MNQINVEEMQKKLEDFVGLVESRNVSSKDVENLLDYVTISKENFFTYIMAADSFSRESDVFKVLTELHHLAHVKKEIYQKDTYNEFYREMIFDDVLQKEFKEFEKQYKEKEKEKVNRVHLLEDENLQWFKDFLKTCDIEYFRGVNENNKS